MFALAALLLAAPPADLLLVNGRVWTGDPAKPEATAVAIAGDRIIAVGTDAEIRAAGPNVIAMDLGGRRVLPAFGDAHVHLLGAGRQLGQVALKDAADAADWGKRIEASDAKLPRERWLLGGAWDHEKTFAKQLPDAALLDKHLPSGRPALLRRYDGHMSLANKRALQLAGIDANTPDPPGGQIDRLPGGREPSGILRDNAVGLVEKVVPPPDDAEIAEAVRGALQELARNGVAAVDDMDGTPDAGTRARLLAHYRRLDALGQLTCRVRLFFPLTEFEAAAKEKAVPATPLFSIGGVKGYLDGSLGSRTAKLFTPYADDPGHTGLWVTPRQRAAELAAEARKRGLDVALHAIGDEANSVALEIAAGLPAGPGRFRIEHAQHLPPADIGKFKQTGTIASVQPLHLADDALWAADRLGATRLPGSYAYKSLLASGATVAFGSDWPVAPANPLATLVAATNPRPAGWPDERLSLVEAITAHTAGPAIAAGQANERGRIAAGFLADVVVLHGDPLAGMSPVPVGTAGIALTIVGGRIVHRDPHGP